MIDKKELRIGNLLKCGDKIVEVEDIGDTGINLQWLHEMSHYDYDYNQLSPIELTPEWLEKIGEKCTDINGWEYQIRVGALKWYFRWNTEWYSEIGGIYIDSKVQYVHQMQNLYFALTGKEISIISFNQSN